jgi:ParB family chromosome partitioning protein
MLEGTQQYQEVEISKIVIPDKRATATFTKEQHDELKASILTNGFTVPILVRPLPDGKYELIDGLHRIEIVKELDWTKIPAIVTSADEKKASILNILANTARGSQNPIDIAEMLDKTLKAGATIDELAAATGHTKDWVEFYLTLVKLPDVYKDALRQGVLKVGVVREALRMPTPELTDAALAEAIKMGWTVEQMKTIVDRYVADEAVKQFKKGELTSPEELPKFDTTKLLEYDDCMICKRKVPRGQTWMKVICNDCLTLTQYLVDNLGDPKEALDYVYKALKRQMEYERYMELKKQFEPEVKKEEEKKPESSTPPFPTSG